MIKSYIGIDSHKASNSIAFAFSGTRAPEYIGKVSADIGRFIQAMYKIMNVVLTFRLERGTSD
jgi:hypothetical protein